ncbi:UbiE family methyltransferase [Hysterangium stoloniferum]|nr:UbiE family methyltransferase [Hysterangium stoloniferum]
MSSKSGQYVHGHHESVLRSHTWRTATNSAAYLLKYIKPNMSILDVGCGPGTITADLAALVPEGKVIGLEYASIVLEQARATSEQRGLQNVQFAVGDVHALDYPDDTFDIVHAHQVLQHIHDPVQALREMRRVTKPGGIVAARDFDCSSMIWFPEVEGMNEWKTLYRQVSRFVGGEPDAGRQLHVWARKAGFEKTDITATASTWCFNIAEDVKWWSELWADRTVSSSFASNAIDSGYADAERLARVARTWREWGGQEDAWFTFIHGEIICHV